MYRYSGTYTSLITIKDCPSASPVTHEFTEEFEITDSEEKVYRPVPLDPETNDFVYEPVKLRQDWRSFDFLSPWEGMGTAIPGDEKAGAAPDRDGKS